MVKGTPVKPPQSVQSRVPKIVGSSPKESLDDIERGMLRLDMATCISCSSCEEICPNKTIGMVEVATAKGKREMPQVGLDRCMFCALCAEVCPTKCLVLTKEYGIDVDDRRLLVKRPEELQG